MVFVIIGMAASLVSAGCAAVCLGLLLRKGEAAERPPAEPEGQGADTALREGMMNLLRYVPGGSGEEEE